jgi:arylsulfatase I/J
MHVITAFVNGGLLPESRRGAVEHGLITAWDWYATYASLANVEPTDPAAAAAGLPPIDSINQWPMLSGTNSTSARAQFAIGDTSTLNPNGDGNTLVGGVIFGDYKLLVGTEDRIYQIGQDTLTGPFWPNSRYSIIPTICPPS